VTAKTATEILDELKGETRVKLAITDVDGILRGKYINKDKLAGVLDGGLAFCNVVFGWDAGDVCYDNVSYTGWRSGYPDAQVRLDPSTLRRVPWDDDVPFFLGSFVEADGETPLPICPRQVLRGVVKKAEQLGFTAAMGMEFEWFNFAETPKSLAAKSYRRPEPITPGMFGYSILRASQSQPFLRALMEELQAFRVPIEGLHTETGPGVLEAAILYSDAIEAGDRAVLFKSAAKEIGHRFGIMPSFMAKWDERLPGCSGHIHQSLWTADGKNAFFDERNPHKMSATFKSYLAGQLACMRDLLPLYAPTVNSYKRLVEGAWAPTRANWGIDNRTTALRAIPGSSKATRLETRVSGSDVNPYLALAAALASGLHGVEQKLELSQAAVAGSGYRDEIGARLWSNLRDSAEGFARSPVAKELLGAAFVDHYADTRRWEWRQFEAAVTSWETERYFEII